MSGLAAVLAGREPSGVYRWKAAYDVVDVRHTVEHVGRRFAYVDGWLAQTRREVLVAIGAALGFPDHYGVNLDALWDCLRDLDEDIVLLWDGWSTLARADERAFAGIVRVLRDRSESGSAFAVLLRGDGPDIDLPTLD